MLLGERLGRLVREMDGVVRWRWSGAGEVAIGLWRSDGEIAEAEEPLFETTFRLGEAGIEASADDVAEAIRRTGNLPPRKAWPTTTGAVADRAAVAAWDAAALERAARGLPAPPLPDEVRRAWALECWGGERWPKARLEPYGWQYPPVDDEGQAMVPLDVYNGLEATFPWCEGDVLSWELVTWFGREFGWHEAAEWIEDHLGEYLLGVYQGFDFE